MLLLALHGCPEPADTKPARCEPKEEVPYDGLDQDCDGADLTDVDRDGSSRPDDCDDADASVYPGATEVRGDAIDQDCDGRDLSGLGAMTGTWVDSGFGARVAIAGGGVYVAAPFGATTGLAEGAVYREGKELRRGAPGAFCGHGLATLGEGIVYTCGGSLWNLDGDELATGVTSVLAARGTTWAVGTPTGYRTEKSTVDLGARPDSLALLSDGTVVAGFARGEIAIRFAAGGLSRAEVGDEAGYSLAVGDVDGDGTEDLVVGAPGAGKAYVMDPARAAFGSSLSGSGRFGHALATGEGVLWIGAPRTGDAAQGAVYRSDAWGSPVLLAEGTVPDDQLGFAIAASGDLLAVGAPGRSDTAGVVFLYAP